MLSPFRGIEGLEGKEPVGAVLTIGTKGGNGAPTDRDRFWIKVPDSSNDVRVPHPSFASFNYFRPPPEEATPEQKAQYQKRELTARQSVRGVLVHAGELECFEWHRKAQKLPGGFKNHSKLPACTGDGRQARRLQMVENEVRFQDIPCPNHLCQFAQAPNDRTPPACKPWARLLFQPVWKDGSPLPTPLMKFTTQSWHSIAAIVGFFEHIKEQARLCGVEHPQLFGLPFEMTLSEKSSPEKRTKFPVIRITPTIMVQAFLIGQVQRSAQLQEGKRYIGLLDAPEQDLEVVHADHREVNIEQPRGQ